MNSFVSVAMLPLLVLAVGCKSEKSDTGTDLSTAADLVAAGSDLVAAGTDLSAGSDLTTATDLSTTSDPDLVSAPPDLVGVPACDAIVLQPNVNFYVPSGGTSTLVVSVTRGSATGPLTVSANDPSGQVSAAPIVIAESDTQGELTFAGITSAVNLNGVITVTAFGACTLAETVNYNLGGTGDFTLAIAPTSKSISRDTSDNIAVVIERIAGFGGRTVTITASGLPTGVTVAPVELSGGDSTTNLVFVVSPIATLGTVDVTITGSATLPSGVATRSATLTLTIAGVPGFSLGALSSVSVVQGDDYDLDLTVTRDVGYTAALTTELQQPPSGVTTTGGSFTSGALDATLTILAAPDARLLVPTAATLRTTDGTVARTAPLNVLVTPAPDAQRDATFGTDGVKLRIESRDGGDYPLAVHRTNDGKLLVYSISGVRRFDADGEPDATFTNTPFPTGPSPRAVAHDPSSGAVFGAVTSSPTELVVGKFAATGVVDTAFGTAGISTVPIPGLNLEVAAIAAANGKVYVGLWADTTTTDVIVARFDAADGSLDTSFGDEGIFVFDSGGMDYVAALQPLSDGGLMVVAQIPAAFPNVDTTLLRLDVDGALDTNFSGDGVLSLLSLRSLPFAQPLVRGDVLQLIGQGYEPDPGIVYHEVVRLSVTTGVVDTDFGTDGLQRIDGLGQIWALAEDGDQLVVCGRDLSATSSNLGMFMARLDADATLDSGFGAGGVSTIRGGTPEGFMQACTALTIDAEGDYWAFGQFQPNHFIAKYHP